MVLESSIATKLAARVLLSLILSMSAIAIVAADGSSPLLAAYYDHQMAIVDGTVYAWTGNTGPAGMIPVGFSALIE